MELFIELQHQETQPRCFVNMKIYRNLGHLVSD